LQKWERSYVQVFELLTPRDRDRSFEAQIVKKSQTSLHSELEAKVLSTYASGMGYRDIASHVEEMYDHKISAAEISNITDKLLPLINKWRSCPLQSVYPIVFMVFQSQGRRALRK
jgi:putative transposase